MVDFETTFEAVLNAVPAKHFDRDRFVPGTGRIDADVMLVGEAPGATEVEHGEPFVGAAGSRLDATLEAHGIDRDDLYITNLVKVRPPDNRTPRRAEIEAWWPVLEAEIDRVDPETIVPLGTTATQEILGTDDGITAVHGTRFERDGRAVIPTFHPAALLYDRSKTAAFEEDLAIAIGRS